MPPTTSHPAGPLPLGVPLINWPSQERERRRLAGLGRPRVLLTAADDAPPSLLDDREAWVRGNSDAATVLAAMEAVAARAAGGGDRPLLDDDGFLHHRGRWAPIAPAQVPVLAHLLHRYRELVPQDDLCALYRRAGRPVNRASVAPLVARLDAVVMDLGLRVHNVRRRGVMLAPDA